jgi:hypothetical protein
MRRKQVVILPLASALGALVGNGMAPAEAKSVSVGDAAINSQETSQTGLRPNTLVLTGESLLGFVMTEQSDGGTVVAQHASHASHASHHSHSSSR